jgi:two-component system sensor histidine kinase UhpB
MGVDVMGEFPPKDNRKDKDTGFSFNLPGILDAVPFYVLLVDEDHYILYANKAVYTALGVDPQDIVGEYCPRAIHGVDGPFHGCPLEEAIELNQGVEREVFDDKSERWLLSCVYPTEALTNNGKRIYFHMVTDITDRVRTDEELRASHRRLQDLARHLETAREEERKHIARDLHDETSQVITSLNAQLEAAIGMMPAGGGKKTAAKLRQAQALSTDILDQIHRLIYELHPPVLDDLGLIASVNWLIDNSLKPAGIKVTFETGGKAARLPRQLEATVFRVIQEAISNIVKHSKAGDADLRLHFWRDSLTVDITDNGTGFDVQEVKNQKDGFRGFGLMGMEERVQLVDGTFDIQASPDSGTKIQITIPFRSIRH